MLGKTFKGMTDAMLEWQTQRFLELADGPSDGYVVKLRPEQVVEIALDGLQASSRYPGGVALRFARVVRYRDDKSAAEADTIDAVRAIHILESLSGATPMHVLASYAHRAHDLSSLAGNLGGALGDSARPKSNRRSRVSGGPAGRVGSFQLRELTYFAQSPYARHSRVRRSMPRAPWSPPVEGLLPLDETVTLDRLGRTGHRCCRRTTPLYDPLLVTPCPRACHGATTRFVC